MRTFRLALAQINPTVGDIEGNTNKILSYIADARASNADLVAFPELAITGYPPEDLLYMSSFIEANVQAMKRVASASQDIAVVVGFVDGDHDIYNAAALAYQGEVTGIYHKMRLPNYGVFDEERYFKRGTRCPVYVVSGTCIGINVCEDIWFPMGPIVVQRVAGAELVVNINASPYHAGKRSQREEMVSTRAAENELYVAYLNTVGGQDELVFDGGSVIFDQTGDVVARGREFEEELIVADLNIESVSRSRLQNPRPHRESEAILKEIGTPSVHQVSGYQATERPPLPSGDYPEPLDLDSQIYRALVVGTHDYVKKSGFSKVIIGLSGGVDSSLTACIATDALGKENVLGVAMPSRYSSEGSLLDARELADRLGIEQWVIPIEQAHAAFLDMLEPSFRDTQPGVAEENVQARTRGNIIMTISNKFGWLVLTTGNKSEMAMGYATLYGDMAGGFAVLKDVPKTLVYRLARWRNRNGLGAGPIPQSVLDKPPSAELRPDQTDQESLPPYDVLDPVIEAYVEDDRSYNEMIEMGFDPQVVRQVISAADRNEYKRRQAPPGVKITLRAFGKDRRLPIVNRYRQF